MPSAGPNNTGTVTSDSSSGGTSAWSNTGNVAASDDAYATASIDLELNTHYLKCTNFGFTVPGGATITGIVVKVEGKLTGSVAGKSAYLVIGGTVRDDGDDKGGNLNLSGTESIQTLGGSADLWGLTPSVADANGSGFGVVIMFVGNSTGTVSIDHVTITVHYTGGSTTSIAAVVHHRKQQGMS